MKVETTLQHCPQAKKLPSANFPKNLQKVLLKSLCKVKSFTYEKFKMHGNTVAKGYIALQFHVHLTSQLIPYYLITEL